MGDAHLLELAAWHLNSADYIADTLRLQQSFAKGELLDFGGGIGSHALAAAALPTVKRVWYVDLNPHNRAFVEWRAQQLGLAAKLARAAISAIQNCPPASTRSCAWTCWSIYQIQPDNWRFLRRG